MILSSDLPLAVPPSPALPFVNVQFVLALIAAIALVLLHSRGQ